MSWADKYDKYDPAKRAKWPWWKKTGYWLETDWPWIPIGAIVIGLLVVLAGFIDVAINYDVIDTQSARVIDKQYDPSKTSVGVGPVVGGGSEGGSGVVVVTSSESEKWTLIVNRNNDIESYTVDADLYYTVNVGDVITVEQRSGRVFAFKDWEVSGRESQ